MRWPFGPPHLTLKPSKKKKETKNKKKSKTKKNRKKKEREKTKKHKNAKKELFSYQSIFSFFMVGVQNFPFLTTWPKKERSQKNTIKIGFQQPIFWKTVLSHETAIFGQKKPKSRNSSYHFFFCLFSSLTTTKTQKLAETPIFIVFWQT